MNQPSMPLPPPPEMPSKPRGFLFVYSVVLLAVVLAAVATFFVMGTFWPLAIGFAVLAFIALQYLLWGWWFERTLKPVEWKEIQIGSQSFLLSDLLLSVTCFAVAFGLLSGIPWPGMRTSEAQQAIAGLVGAAFGAALGAFRRRAILGAAIGGMIGLVYAVIVAAIPP